MSSLRLAAAARGATPGGLEAAGTGVVGPNAASRAGLRGSSRAPVISLRGEEAHGGEATFSKDAEAAWAEAHKSAAETLYMPRARTYVGSILGTNTLTQDESKRFSASELQDLKGKAEHQVFNGQVAMPSSRWRD
ncbi:unnamed protein product [Prorocentrum cordatum]|uniref:Uncharacterized protein n=1 Tax=Prorocentrum cordatum TaxID=2364126 RepID=A0ABN9X3J6_9DINO|nr:unnamed protein product [Polarella glacialis]